MNTELREHRAVLSLQSIHEKTRPLSQVSEKEVAVSSIGEFVIDISLRVSGQLSSSSSVEQFIVGHCGGHCQLANPGLQAGSLRHGKLTLVILVDEPPASWTDNRLALQQLVKSLGS